jgi:superkiller protein 3
VSLNDVTSCLSDVQNQRNYPPAITALQVALRAEPEDQLSWLRLGEAYSKAGRHIGAVKALDRARELQPDDWMCTYLIGDVKQQMGHFGDAIAAFESILDTRPSEVGVLVSLGQAYLDLGRSELSEGFHARAERSFVTCIRVGLRTVHESPGFRALAWKTVADAIYSLSNRSTFHDEENVRLSLSEVVCLFPSELEHLTGVLVVPLVLDDALLTGIKTLEIAAAAYSYRISLGSSEVATKSGSAWFDLGIALHSWITRLDNGADHEKAKKKAIECLTQAVREDPGNDAYWVALGDVNFLTNAKTAQHAYIKALEINSKVILACLLLF